MATNYARRATDGRRAVNKRGLPTLLHTNGHTVLHEVPRTTLATPTTKTTVLIPGVLTVHGAESPLLGGFLVTFMGAVRRMTRALINRLLELNHALRVAMEAQRFPKTVKTEAPTVPLLTARCMTAKPVTEQPITYAVAA